MNEYHKELWMKYFVCRNVSIFDRSSSYCYYYSYYFYFTGDFDKNDYPIYEKSDNKSYYCDKWACRYNVKRKAWKIDYHLSFPPSDEKNLFRFIPLSYDFPDVKKYNEKLTNLLSLWKFENRNEYDCVIKRNITNLFLINNRYEVFLPPEMWFLILSFIRKIELETEENIKKIFDFQ